MRPTIVVYAISLMLAPMAALAQETAAAASPAPPAASQQDQADVGSFDPGFWYAGPRIWLGVYGTIAIGGQVELAYSEPGQYGPGIVGIGAGVDYYSYDYGSGAFGGSYTVIPISAFANYHFVLENNRRIDPYVGLGLGYYLVSASGSGQTARAGAVFLALQLGGRYFMTPRLAAQAHAGVGVGNISLGLAYKF